MSDEHQAAYTMVACAFFMGVSISGLLMWGLFAMGVLT